VRVLVFLRTGSLDTDQMAGLLGNPLAYARYAIYGFPDSTHRPFMALGVFVVGLNGFK
jgi:hypothetical protein